MTRTRRFPPPWSVDDIGGCFVVKASNDRPLVFIYYGEGVPRPSLARLMTRSGARRIAEGFAKLPDLVQWLMTLPCRRAAQPRCGLRDLRIQMREHGPHRLGVHFGLELVPIFKRDSF